MMNTNHQKMIAESPFPSLRLNTLSDSQVEIGKPVNGADWQMVVVYRGKHCPLCTQYLQQLEEMKNKFYNLGIGIIVISADPAEKAVAHNQEMKLSFPVAYGLSIEQMKTLGLYISNPRSSQETDRPFSEPGLFVINEKGQVQLIDISNGPFARPELETLVFGLDFIRNPENHYPIRGTYSD
ncbi:MAG: redoxin domain-containing protein [Bermanella sp.]